MILLLLLQYQFQAHWSKPLDFCLSLLGALMNNLLFVYGLYALVSVSASGTPKNSDQFLCASGLVVAAWGLIHLLLGGLADLGTYITSGELDNFLARPRHPLLLVAWSKSELMSLAELLQGLAVLLYLGINQGALFSLKLLLALGMVAVALLGAIILGGSLAFFFQRGDAISVMFARMVMLMSIFPMNHLLIGGERALIYCTPLFFSYFLPRQFMTYGGVAWCLLGYAGSLLLLTGAVYLFTLGLKQYQSANFIRLRS